MKIQPLIWLFLLFISCPAWQNLWQGRLRVTCPLHHSIYRIQSIHDNAKEDRRWQMECRETRPLISNCSWYDNISNWDLPVNFSCPANGAIVGFGSHFHYYKGDRMWSYKCCEMPENRLRVCETSDYVNKFDGPMNYTLFTNYYLTGVFSYHENTYEDRLWKFISCPLCNGIDGRCECADGWYGDKCLNKCDDRNCLLKNSSCDHATGECIDACQAGYTSLDCKQECGNGTYGVNCLKECSARNCLDRNSPCDRVTGKCIGGCRAGFDSEDCSEKCPEGFYGERCQRKCWHRNCLNGSSCDHVTGECVSGCRFGFQAKDCVQVCHDCIQQVKAVTCDSGKKLIMLLILVLKPGVLSYDSFYAIFSYDILRKICSHCLIGSSDSTHTVVGTVLGLIFGFLLGVFGVYLFLKYRKKSSKKNNAHGARNRTRVPTGGLHSISGVQQTTVNVTREDNDATTRGTTRSSAAQQPSCNTVNSETESNYEQLATVYRNENVYEKV